MSIISGVTLFQGFRSTGVQEIQEYRVQEIQECQMSGHIIIMNMPGNTGARCQVSGIRCYILCGKYSMSNTGVIYQVSNIAWQVPMSGIICPI